MRLPFMQLESDLVAHGASTVAALAGCSVPQALGHIALLRAWSVSRATDEAPPDGFVPGDAAPRLIEAAAQWTGEKGALLQALLDAGQVAREETGLRVLHLNPYVTAWERNAKAKARMANARERSQNMRVTDGERSAKFGGQTQTQTQTQKETAASQGAADAGPPADDLPDATDDAHPLTATETMANAIPLFPEAEATKPVKTKGPDPEALRELWNRLAPQKGLQRWESMSKKRAGEARAALSAVPDLARWEAWLVAELARPWNLGENDSGWRADVDWLLRSKTRDLVADFNPATAPRSQAPTAPPKPTKFITL